MSRDLRAGAIATGLLFALGACGSDDDAGLPRIALSPPATGPYVSVAVDNHFHDIHAEDDIAIAADRSFVVENQGRNLHNVTIPGTEISTDISPGESFELDPLGATLAPGVYQVVCKYHGDQGMFGAITVVPAEG